MSTPEKKKTKKKGRKAPGMFSFVALRQFAMLLAAPYAASALMPVFGMEKSWIAMLIAVALPAFAHGQLWKWTYDWYRPGADVVMRNLRVGQIALGVVHTGLVGWALALLITGDVVMGDGDGRTSGFFVGLAIAGFVGGIWETVRPALELRDRPEVKEEAARQAARAAARAEKAKAAAAQVEADEASTEPAAAADTASDEPAPPAEESSEDPSDVPTVEKPAPTE